MRKPSLRLLALLSTLSLTACVTPGGGSITTGNAATASTGAAGGASSVNANPSLERCDAPLGTLAVDDGRDKEWYGSFGAATKITTIEPLIRLAVQQSNCFVITSIGSGRTESKLSAITDKQRNSGEFRAGSKQQKGQRVAADYYLEPSIIIDNDAVGGMAAGVGGLFGSVGAAIGGGAGPGNKAVAGGDQAAVGVQRAGDVRRRQQDRVRFAGASRLETARAFPARVPLRFDLLGVETLVHHVSGFRAARGWQGKHAF